ncbi:MAG: class I SAM-dependent methyltransferase [Chlorobiaceae bacterium]|nr:class I SAM-dependent methyltransferase [Chlorobiaceae bacterium]
MHEESVKELFDRSVERYDQNRRRLIPCFEDFYRTTAELVSFPADQAFSVLDLGAGTGLLSMLISERFPRACFTLVDISGDMLLKARERFAGQSSRFSFLVQDYAADLQGSFDLVVSALSIHHLEDERKEELFRSVYRVLGPEGMFINADQVKGATEPIDLIYRETWARQVQESGISEADFAAAKERMKADRMGTLEDQLGYLRSAGFREVNCWYQNYSFAVCSGRK